MNAIVKGIWAYREKGTTGNRETTERQKLWNPVPPMLESQTDGGYFCEHFRQRHVSSRAVRALSLLW